MADTSQIVSWALEYSCKLRAGDAVTNPAEALKSTGDARLYSAAFRRPANERSIYGNACVTGYGLAETAKKPVLYPWSGFLIPEVFRELGGAEGLFRMCANCPANTIPARLANCTGTIYPPAEPEKFDERLRRLVDVSRIAEGFCRRFPRRPTPLWFGLWTASPLSPEALRILKILMCAILEEEGAKELGRWILENFVAAMEIAGQRSLPLHVSMSPPGHTDFGIYTIFPALPVLQSGRGGRALEGGPTRRSYNTCEVCGTRYSPVETATRERYEMGRGRVAGVDGAGGVRGAGGRVSGGPWLDSRGGGGNRACRGGRGARTKRGAKENSAAGGVAPEIFEGGNPKRVGEPLQVGEGIRSSGIRCARFCGGAGEVREDRREDFLDVAVSRRSARQNPPTKPADPVAVLREWDEPGCLFGAVFETPEEVLLAYAAAK